MPTWLPNLLTAVRILLTPFIAIALASSDFQWAAWLLVAASVTDFLDGRLARRYALHSKLGERLDPIADKFLMVAVFLALGWAGLFPVWLVALVIGRDLLILGAVVWALRYTTIRTFPPTYVGKLSTTIQMVGAVLAIAARLPGLAVLQNLDPVVIGAIAIVVLWSIYDYWKHGIRLLHQSHSAGRVDGRDPRG